MSTLVAQTISNGTVSTSTANVVNGAKAWVNFNGTTSPGTIRASYNIFQVTKTGTGRYTVNFTNAFADANYAPVGTAEFVGGASPIVNVSDYLYGGVPTTTSCQLYVRTNAGSDIDVLGCYIAVFR
jgi:hypothetical protein